MDRCQVKKVMAWLSRYFYLFRVFLKNFLILENAICYNRDVPGWSVPWKLMNTIQIQKLKNLLNEFFNEKKVKPPLTSKKIKKAGYEVSPFLLELRDRLQPFSSEPIIQGYLKACERLIWGAIDISVSFAVMASTPKQTRCRWGLTYDC